jgi:hypothetical protein
MEWSSPRDDRFREINADGGDQASLGKRSMSLIVSINCRSPGGVWRRPR